MTCDSGDAKREDGLPASAVGSQSGGAAASPSPSGPSLKHDPETVRVLVEAPYAAFERDVPEHLRDDAMTAMAEATGGWGAPANVTIVDHDRIDAINCRAAGIIEIEGREFTFQMEDGNWNGTVLLAWESDKPFEYHVPTRWALQPQRDLIDDAIMNGRGRFLLLKWDGILKNRPELAAIPGKYSYDRYVQPGGKVEGYWRDKAGKHLFEIVTEETAQETRAALLQAQEPQS